MLILGKVVRRRCFPRPDREYKIVSLRRPGIGLDVAPERLPEICKQLGAGGRGLGDPLRTREVKVALRIAFYGNVSNTLYQVAKALRQRSDFDAHLFVDRGCDLQQLPESDDPGLRGNDPPWIHRGDFDGLRARLAPWKSPLVDALKDFDLAVVSSLGPLYAQFSGRPTCFLVTGADLTVTPFPPEFYFSYPTLKTKLGWTWLGYWQRRGIRRAKEIWSHPFSPYTQALERLRIPPERVAPVHFPLVIDSRKFRYNPHARAATNGFLKRIVEKHDFVLFHPSRLMIQSNWRLRRSGQWKRNDVLLQGFARFLARSGARRSALVMPDRTLSPDVALAKRIIQRLGIERHVVWLVPPRPQGFSRDELIPLYSIADVVADDFGIGWFGGVVLEALAIGRPVLSYIDPAAMAKLYPWHPILSANTPEGIADHLERLYAEPGLRRDQGRQGQRWIEEFHAEESAGRIYARHFADLSNRLGLGKRTR